MPELPEITQLARQMDSALPGKRITDILVIQEKCLNLPKDDFIAALVGATFNRVENRGKWIVAHTDQGWLLLNLGMGGEILLVDSGALPPKHRLVFSLHDGMSLSINFWWFGYAHYAPEDQLASNPMLARIGPSMLGVDQDIFEAHFTAVKTNVKTILLDQSRMSGLGNSYIHDVLFLARIHPLRKANSLSADERANLYGAAHAILERSLAKHGAFYEVDLYGQKGSYLMDDLVIGYREGQPCPVCGSPIIKIKTGGTSSFICPVCQRL